MSTSLIESGVRTCEAPADRDSFGPFFEVQTFGQPSDWTGDWIDGNAVAVGDIDGDGREDILLIGYYRIQFFLQQPDGRFEESLGRLDLADPHAANMSNLIDLDGDGDLDLSLANDRSSTTPPDPGDVNELFERTGPLTWQDVSDRLQTDGRDGYTKLTPRIDADLDLDLYVVNHMPFCTGNRLLQNDGTGQFSEWPAPGLDLAVSGMGLDQADINGDGWMCSRARERASSALFLARCGSAGWLTIPTPSVPLCGWSLTARRSGCRGGALARRQREPLRRHGHPPAPHRRLALITPPCPRASPSEHPPGEWPCPQAGGPRRRAADRRGGAR